MAINMISPDIRGISKEDIKKSNSFIKTALTEITRVT